MSMQNQKVPGRTPSLLLHLLLYVRLQIHWQLEQDTFANISRVKLLSKIPQLNLWKLNMLSRCSCLACTVEQALPKAMEKFFRMNTAPAVQIWDSPLCKARETFSSLLRKMPKSTSWFFCSKRCCSTTNYECYEAPQPPNTRLCVCTVPQVSSTDSSTSS